MYCMYILLACLWLNVSESDIIPGSQDTPTELTRNLSLFFIVIISSIFLSVKLVKEHYIQHILRINVRESLPWKRCHSEVDNH